MADITGIIYGSTSNPDIESGISWSETVDVAANTGVVTASLYLRTSTGYKTYSNDSDFSITVNGTKYAYNNHYFEVGPGTGWTEVALLVAHTVPHNADGTKSIVISATGSMTGTSVTSISCSETVSLYTIPRASTIIAPASTTNVSVDGVNTVNISLDRKISTHTHTVRVYVGASYAAATYKHEFTGVATSISWAIPIAWRLTMPTSTTGTASIDVLTYSGATQIGSTVTGTFIISVPPSVVPPVSLSNVTIAPVQEVATTGFTTYVQGYSRAGATFSPTGWSGYECAISSYYIQLGSAKVDESPYRTAILTTSGTIAVTVGVTDARGRTGTYTTNLTVYSYSKPSLASVTVFRSDGSGVASESGGYISSTQSALFAACGGQNSIVYLRGRYKATSSETYSAWTTLSNGGTTLVGAGALSSTVSYDYEIQVQDETGNYTPYPFVIATALVPFNVKKGNRGVAVGKYAETDDLFESALDFKAPSGAFTGALSAESLALTTPLPLLGGGLEANTAAGGRATLGIYGLVFTSVAQIGQTVGSATINGCFASMSNGTTLFAPASDFNASEVPSGKLGIVTIFRSLSIRASCDFYGKTSADGRYCQRLTSLGTTFDGTWHRIYTEFDITQLKSDAGLSVASTTTPATTPTLSASYDEFRLYKVGKHVDFNIRYTATISASGTDAAIIPEAYRPAEGFVALGCYSSGTNPFEAQAYASSAGTIRVRLASAVTNIIVSGSWVTA